MAGRTKFKTLKCPWADLHLHLQGYQARALPEYSNGKRHVYESNTVGYITVRKKGNYAHMEFTGGLCPCGWDD